MLHSVCDDTRFKFFETEITLQEGYIMAEDVVSNIGDGLKSLYRSVRPLLFSVLFASFHERV